MLYILFLIGLIWLGWKLIVFAIKATWGITKVLLYCIFRKNCASVPEERCAIPLQTEQSSAG